MGRCTYLAKRCRNVVTRLKLWRKSFMIKYLAKNMFLVLVGSMPLSIAHVAKAEHVEFPFALTNDMLDCSDEEIAKKASQMYLDFLNEPLPGQISEGYEGIPLRRLYYAVVTEGMYVRVPQESISNRLATMVIKIDRPNREAFVVGFIKNEDMRSFGTLDAQSGDYSLTLDHVDDLYSLIDFIYDITRYCLENDDPVTFRNLLIMEPVFVINTLSQLSKEDEEEKAKKAENEEDGEGNAEDLSHFDRFTQWIMSHTDL